MQRDQNVREQSEKFEEREMRESERFGYGGCQVVCVYEGEVVWEFFF